MENILLIPLKMLGHLCILVLTVFLQHQEIKGEKAANKPNPAFIPAVNPHPKYFMTVKGHIAPSLKNKLKLEWITDFETTSPKCQVVTNEFEGVYWPRTYRKKVWVKTNAQGHYKIQLPIDFFTKGKCGWQPNGLEYEVYNQNGKTVKLGLLNGVGLTTIKNKRHAGRTAFSQYKCFHSQKLYTCRSISDKLFNHHNNLYFKQPGLVYKVDIIS